MYPRKINMVKAKNFRKPHLSVNRKMANMYYGLFRTAKLIQFISKHYNYESDSFKFEIPINEVFKYYYNPKYLLPEGKESVNRNESRSL